MIKSIPFVFGASLLAGVAMSAQADTPTAKNTGGIKTGTGITALAVQSGAGLNFDTAGKSSVGFRPAVAQEKGLTQAEKRAGEQTAAHANGSKLSTQGSTLVKAKAKDNSSHKPADQAQGSVANVAADTKASGAGKAEAE